jgi:hypothetical protein
MRTSIQSLLILSGIAVRRDPGFLNFRFARDAGCQTPQNGCFAMNHTNSSRRGPAP